MPPKAQSSSWDSPFKVFFQENKARGICAWPSLKAGVRPLHVEAAGTAAQVTQEHIHAAWI